MRLPRVRFTVRRLMLVVLLIALATGFHLDQRRRAGALTSAERAWRYAESGRLMLAAEIRLAEDRIAVQHAMYEIFVVENPGYNQVSANARDSSIARFKEYRKPFAGLLPQAEAKERAAKAERDRLRSLVLWPYR